MRTKVSTATRLNGQPLIPGDKSISHRALIFGALADGTTTVKGLLESADVLATAECLKALGVGIQKEADGNYTVQGVGIAGFQTPAEPLNCANSGTTLRLLMGVLAGQNLSATLLGDASLNRRPMKRIAQPLSQMGARFTLTQENFAPLTVQGRAHLRAIDYTVPVASAQLKSAVLLAGLLAEGTTYLRGKIQSRDHTERMLPHFGVQLNVQSDVIAIHGGQRLRASMVEVPSDPSTAAFWIAGATLVENSQIKMRNIMLNPSRTGFIQVLKRMGAHIESTLHADSPEVMGDVEIRSASLKGTSVYDDEIPSLIDEVPLLAVVACFAHGRTEVRGAAELRIKESDRIAAVAKNLRAMGAEIEVLEDGFIIEGPQKLNAALIDSMHDHRIAMAFAIAGLMATGETEIEHAECVAVSYPNFFETLAELTRG